jgi:hypothetical protein
MTEKLARKGQEEKLCGKASTHHEKEWLPETGICISSDRRENPGARRLAR